MLHACGHHYHLLCCFSAFPSFGRYFLFDFERFILIPGGHFAENILLRHNRGVVDLRSRHFRFPQYSFSDLCFDLSKLACGFLIIALLFTDVEEHSMVAALFGCWPSMMHRRLRILGRGWMARADREMCAASGSFYDDGRLCSLCALDIGCAVVKMLLVLSSIDGLMKGSRREFLLFSRPAAGLTVLSWDLLSIDTYLTNHILITHISLRTIHCAHLVSHLYQFS